MTAQRTESTIANRALRLIGASPIVSSSYDEDIAAVGGTGTAATFSVEKSDDTGAVEELVCTSRGTGYALNDVLTLDVSLFSNGLEITVTDVDGGGQIFGWTITSPGHGYTGRGDINGLSELILEETMLKEIYRTLKNSCLTDAEWGFAKYREVLDTPAVATPAFKYDFKFPLSDLSRTCLHVWRVNDKDIGSEWELEDGYILCNFEEIEVEYTWVLKDVDKMSDKFIEALVVRLAADLSPTLSKNKSERDDFLKEYEMKIGKAGNIDGTQGSHRRFKRGRYTTQVRG